MTIRSKLEADRNRVMLFGFLAWLTFGVSGFGINIQPIFFAIITAIAFIAFLATIIYSIYGLRCPNRIEILDGVAVELC